MDLHREQGRDVVRALAERADVLVENFRPGVMEKWGLGPEVLFCLLGCPSLAAVPEMLSRAARPACHALHHGTVRALQPGTLR